VQDKEGLNPLDLVMKDRPHYINYKDYSEYDSSPKYFIVIYHLDENAYLANVDHCITDNCGRKYHEFYFSSENTHNFYLKIASNY
jgi:hypothetical protein